MKPEKLRIVTWAVYEGRDVHFVREYALLPSGQLKINKQESPPDEKASPSPRKVRRLRQDIPLYELYIVKEMSIIEIAAAYHRSPAAIWERLKRRGIPRRPTGVRR